MNRIDKSSWPLGEKDSIQIYRLYRVLDSDRVFLVFFYYFKCYFVFIWSPFFLIKSQFFSIIFTIYTVFFLTLAAFKISLSLVFNTLTQQTQSRKNTKKAAFRHIIVKVLKTKEREILKAAKICKSKSLRNGNEG